MIGREAFWPLIWILTLVLVLAFGPDTADFAVPGAVRLIWIGLSAKTPLLPMIRKRSCSASGK